MFCFVKFFVKSVNWLLQPETTIKADVQIRSRHQAAPACLTPLADKRVKVTFKEPQFSISPGQAAVFYQSDCIAGGGWIE